jgi:site-specific DNA-cytosine methylase
MQDPINSETVAPCLSSGSPNGQATVGVSVDYNVRRLTPLECERLQGYPDTWTRIPSLTKMSDDLYSFWCSVLFEKATIEQRARWNAELAIYEIWREIKPDGGGPAVWENTGKPYKHKTPAQMLSWYNKMVDDESNDAARYKAIGNSIALPSWEFVLQRLSICCGDDVTMASLFDGIGGFPLIWERLNGAGSCLWASEIEEFPIAVTKHHFSEEG